MPAIRPIQRSKNPEKGLTHSSFYCQDQKSADSFQIKWRSHHPGNGHGRGGREAQNSAVQRYCAPHSLLLAQGSWEWALSGTLGDAMGENVWRQGGHTFPRQTPRLQGLSLFFFFFSLKEDYTSFLCITSTTVRRSLEITVLFTGASQVPAPKTPPMKMCVRSSAQQEKQLWKDKYRLCLLGVWTQMFLRLHAFENLFGKTVAFILQQGAHTYWVGTWGQAAWAGIRVLRWLAMTFS